MSKRAAKALAGATGAIALAITALISLGRAASSRLTRTSWAYGRSAMARPRA